MEIHGGQLSLAHPSVDAVGFAKTSFNPKRGNTTVRAVKVTQPYAQAVLVRTWLATSWLKYAFIENSQVSCDILIRQKYMNDALKTRKHGIVVPFKIRSTCTCTVRRAYCGLYGTESSLGAKPYESLR
jgi:hypothetical protein